MFQDTPHLSGEHTFNLTSLHWQQCQVVWPIAITGAPVAQRQHALAWLEGLGQAACQAGDRHT